MTKITIETTVNAPINTVWELWNKPEHIMKWNNASSDWHTTSSTVDLKEGGSFSSRMEAKDGSMGFDFGGTFTKVDAPNHLSYQMNEDDRVVSVDFSENNGVTEITETFDAEDTNPIEMQRDGWQAILNNFKQYAESYNHSE